MNTEEKTYFETLEEKSYQELIDERQSLISQLCYSEQAISHGNTVTIAYLWSLEHLAQLTRLMRLRAKEFQTE